MVEKSIDIGFLVEDMAALFGIQTSAHVIAQMDLAYQSTARDPDILERRQFGLDGSPEAGYSPGRNRYARPK